jgi:hypothetical protein
MRQSSLRRLGLLCLLLAGVLYWSTAQVSGLSSNVALPLPLWQIALVMGVGTLVLSQVRASSAGLRGHGACPRCGERSARGSALCPRHLAELHKTADAMARRRV